MTTALTSHEKPRRAQLRAGRGCDRRFVRGGRKSGECRHDVESCRRGHPTLLPSLNGALRDSAEIGERLSGQSAFVADGLDSWRVVHDGPVIREDDGLAVGAAWVIGGDLHGSSEHGLSTGDHPGDGLHRWSDHLRLVVPNPEKGVWDHLSGGKCLELVGSLRKLGGSGEEVFVGWSSHIFVLVIGAALPPTRSIYATMRKAQELFTQVCVFLIFPPNTQEVAGEALPPSICSPRPNVQKPTE